MSVEINDHDQSLNDDEIDELISDNIINTQSKITIKPSSLLSSSISQVQSMSLSMNKSVSNSEENVNENKINKPILSVKTSNIPGPVGLLPILVR